jgi:hypothetical protein
LEEGCASFNSCWVILEEVVSCRVEVREGQRWHA